MTRPEARDTGLSCRRMRRAVVLASVIASLLALTSHPATASGPFGAKRGKALRLAGIVEPPSCDAASCLGMLRLQVGQTVRNFGVTMAQAGNVEGMVIFQGFALQSQNLRLLGPTSMVQPFLDAAPGTVVHMWGLFKGLDFVLGQLTVEPGTTSTPTTPTAP
jgi:hypothetical protein